MALVDVSVALHQLVELLVVEFALIALTVLHIDINILMVQHPVSREHALKHITALIILSFAIPDTASKLVTKFK